MAKDPDRRPASAKEVIDELLAIERDLAGTSKSGFNIEVPPLIQIKTGPAAAAPPPPKAKSSGLSGKIRPGKARQQSSLLPWILAGAALALVIAGLFYLLVWLLNTQPTGPTRQPSAFKSKLPARPGTDLAPRGLAES